VTDLSLPPSLDLRPETLAPRLAAFLQTRWGEPVEISDWRRFPAGFSWTTIGFTARRASQREPLALILRIGDPRGLLAPYSAQPEFVALSALQDVPGLPVPRVHAFSDDASFIGAPFLVTGRVEGDTPMPWKGDAARRDAAHNETLALDFVDAIAALHGVDWRSTPLAQLWSGVDVRTLAMNQVEAWARHAGLFGKNDRTGRSPQMHYTLHWLRRHAPAEGRAVIVHGDYRVGNFLQSQGRITAVLDWELVHLGDPHEDLAWAGLRVFAGGSARIGGLVDRDMFYARYAQQTGFSLDRRVLHYYEVLGLFKSAAMLVGAVRRIETGQARDIRMASMGFQLAATLLEINRLIAEAP
jgi:aminoglycoside phosphotransferase (APT) family kinase protein